MVKFDMKIAKKSAGILTYFEDFLAIFISMFHWHSTHQLPRSMARKQALTPAGQRACQEVYRTLVRMHDSLVNSVNSSH
jgi:hypothetical protein